VILESGAFGEWLGHKGRPFMKDRLQRSAMRDYTNLVTQLESAIYKPDNGFSPALNLLWSWKPQPSKLKEIKFSCL
jgi:hypothetical protein